MSKAFGIHGSTTDHGGMVISTQARSSQMGNLFLRAGDGFACPKCKIWSTLIQSNSHIIFDGKPVAYVGDKFTCGATLMPKQMQWLEIMEGTQEARFLINHRITCMKKIHRTKRNKRDKGNLLELR